MKKSVIAGMLLAVLMTATLRPSYAFLDKTRFATDLGVAFYAFHHWVYGPFRQGAFSSSNPQRTKAMVKGGVALLFAVNRVAAANRIAHKSKSPTLQALAGKLDALQASFSNIGQNLKAGRLNPKDIMSLNGTVSQTGQGSAAAGIPVKDVPVAIPGA